MNFNNTNAHDFRLKRKCFATVGCLIFFLLMSQVSCRPSGVEDVLAYSDGDYTDADDIEWQNFPTVETTTKEHPVIYYKEDIVSEDYDPNKENKHSSKESSGEERTLPNRQKYIEIFRRSRKNRTDTDIDSLRIVNKTKSESYRHIKPERIFFDVYPIEDDGLKDDSTKFDEKNIRVEVISLLDDDGKNSESTDLKHLFSKKPKKFSRHHRQRRDLNEHRLRHKRNPYLRWSSKIQPKYAGACCPNQPIYSKTKYPVRGIYKNAVSPVSTSVTSNPVVVGPRDDFGRPPIKEPPLIHAGDDDYDDYIASLSNTQRVSTTQRPITGWGMSTTRAPARPPATSRPVTMRPKPEGRNVPNCILAITSCCQSGTAQVDYNCFERHYCDGAFWGVNPCSESNIRIASQVNDLYFV